MKNKTIISTAHYCLHGIITLKNIFEIVSLEVLILTSFINSNNSKEFQKAKNDFNKAEVNDWQTIKHACDTSNYEAKSHNEHRRNIPTSNRFNGIHDETDITFDDYQEEIMLSYVKNTIHYSEMQ